MGLSRGWSVSRLKGRLVADAGRGGVERDSAPCPPAAGSSGGATVPAAAVPECHAVRSASETFGVCAPKEPDDRSVVPSPVSGEQARKAGVVAFAGGARGAEGFGPLPSRPRAASGPLADRPRAGSSPRGRGEARNGASAGLWRSWRTSGHRPLPVDRREHRATPQRYHTVMAECYDQFEVQRFSLQERPPGTAGILPASTHRWDFVHLSHFRSAPLGPRASCPLEPTGGLSDHLWAFGPLAGGTPALPGTAFRMGAFPGSAGILPASTHRWAFATPVGLRPTCGRDVRNSAELLTPEAYLSY